ncbi:hypothetical protein QYF36_025235 [Acer negundo]|nr:hypothetical protein QYF36_025235 [Acer negundo]
MREKAITRPSRSHDQIWRWFGWDGDARHDYLWLDEQLAVVAPGMELLLLTVHREGVGPGARRAGNLFAIRCFLKSYLREKTKAQPYGEVRKDSEGE